MIEEPTIADAIPNRIIHNAYRVILEAHSMRRKKPRAPSPTAKTAKPIPIDFNNKATKTQRHHAVRELVKLLCLSERNRGPVLAKYAVQDIGRNQMQPTRAKARSWR
ncbi:hypothetical protein [Bradyrhizobium hereditatis]|uniref:hypothetical protein n=1 Tax=Bradyrhizobium hereditatis TaxID=2821405 RepID=UPI0024C0BA15|nr:hypothetical protein [Bradyrhizobium hereditatis]